ncbi:hypothetical protein EDC56_2253 [Sinobacterium caligoides]|uniref:Ferredoxin-NADP reductase n=1 Tax=Sinobacterium caligoides TaxID=933926 RepID=A0A3N2DR82_9GAMM|nr:MOSC N-terminal beta barrel domain-containing protein [Sinobacterium caligoides]ROS01805.1 hypothetical protein EDC56_2253 [Sinobacterium caligoides]
MAGQLARINVFPIKSAKGLSLSQAWLESAGLSFDRRFMITLMDGSMITSRRYPQLLLITTTLKTESIVFSYPDLPPLTLPFVELQRQPTNTAVWNDKFQAFSTTQEANEWVEKIIGQPAQLLYNGEESQRVGGKAQVKVSFADNFPVMIVSEASLASLNSRCHEQQSMDRFRANLIVTGVEAFTEDSWKRLRIGDVEIEIKAPCSRCVLININPNDAHRDPANEPLATLMSFRTDEKSAGNVNFGMNAIVVKEGMIKQGDSIEVLEYRQPEVYRDTAAKLQLSCVGRESIANDFETFYFSRTDGQKLPSYLPGQHLPLTIPTTASASTSRCYTLSSCPSQNRYAISVKRVKEGVASSWLHDNLQVGDQLKAQQPRGDFYFDPLRHNGKVLLISAGSGITPMLSIVRDAIAHHSTNEIIFYHYCRDQQDIPCADELAAIDTEQPNIKIHIILTQPSVPTQGMRGRICAEHLALAGDITDCNAFVCGSEAFTEQAKSLLLAAGLAESHYHQELFFLAQKAASKKKTVKIHYNGTEFTGNNQQPLLDQIESQGLEINNGCRAGLCGRCKVTITQGEVSRSPAPALTAADSEQGMALSCCSIPQTDINLIQ